MQRGGIMKVVNCSDPKKYLIDLNIGDRFLRQGDIYIVISENGQTGTQVHNLNKGKNDFFVGVTSVIAIEITEIRFMEL